LPHPSPTLFPYTTLFRSIPLGPIGIAVNGVAIFNQYAAGRSPLASEIFSFDRYNGHPQQTGMYPYHVEPLWITSNRGASSLIGVDRKSTCLNSSHDQISY